MTITKNILGGGALLLALVAGAQAQPAPKVVAATIIGNDGKDLGTVTLTGGAHATVIRVMIVPGRITPGWHGVHFHAVGDCTDTAKFEASKAHMNHGGKKHGLLNPDGPDDGDMANVYAAPDGSVNTELVSFTALLTPDGLLDADHSAFLVHAGQDDHMTQPIGGAGARIGCAVIK